ncbi:MAG: membrane protein [Phycisphaerae bacterium]
MSETPRSSEPAGRPAHPPARRSLSGTLRALLRTRLVAGLVTVIPIWMTYEVVRFVFDFAVTTMRAATEPLARRIADLLQKSPDPRVSSFMEAYNNWIVPILAVLLTLFLLYCLGLLAANVFGRRLIGAVEHFFERLPLIKTVYKWIKQIVVAIGGFQSMAFQRVVLVEFPYPGMKRLAFLTSVMTDQDTGRKMASIFFPYTPYVTTGDMQIVPLDDVSETGWTVEQAVKWIMSGGIVHPELLPFDKPRPVLWEMPEPAASGVPNNGPGEHVSSQARE